FIVVIGGGGAIEGPIVGKGLFFVFQGPPPPSGGGGFILLGLSAGVGGVGGGGGANRHLVFPGAAPAQAARAPGRGRKPMTYRFASVEDVTDRLQATGYLADPMIAHVIWLAARLEKPVLAEGPAGTGKTELAKAVAAATGARLIRLQCYEGRDEARALHDGHYS